MNGAVSFILQIRLCQTLCQKSNNVIGRFPSRLVNAVFTQSYGTFQPHSIVKVFRFGNELCPIYTRYSSELQNELSLEAQERHCRRAIAD